MSVHCFIHDIHDGRRRGRARVTSLVSCLIRRHNMLCCMLQSRFSNQVYTTTPHIPLPAPLSVLRSHEISHGLWLTLVVVNAICVAMAVIVVVMAVAIVLRSNVLQLVDAATLWAALNWAVARCCQPNNVVRVNRVTSAAEVLLVAKRLDKNRVLKSSCTTHSTVKLLILSGSVLSG